MLCFYNICQQSFVFTCAANADEKSEKYKHQNSLNSHQPCIFPQRLSNHSCSGTVCSLPSPAWNFFLISSLWPGITGRGSKLEQTLTNPMAILAFTSVLLRQQSDLFWTQNNKSNSFQFLLSPWPCLTLQQKRRQGKPGLCSTWVVLHLCNAGWATG